MIPARANLAVAIVLLSAGSANAQGWEIAILGGWTAPTFEQTVVFDPEIDLPNIPGGSIRQEGVFELNGQGSFAFGGSVSYFFNEHLAIEGRIDTIDFDVETLGPRFEADANVGGIPATAVLDVGMGSINVERLYPLSANLKARTGGGARFVASGGLSYLPHVRFDAFQPVSLSVGVLGIPAVELASVVLQAGALADNREGRWGFNVGAGFEVDVSPTVAIVGDVRVHGFQSQTFVWQRSENSSSELEEILIEQLERLPPIEIELIYFQATGGVSFRF